MSTTSEDDDETPFFKTLSAEVQCTVQGLRGVEVHATNLRKEYKKEALALELKYVTKCQPLYDRRKQIIAGIASVTLEEIALGEEQSRKDDDDYDRLSPPKKSSISPAPICGFWLRALQTHPGFDQRIERADEDALKYLTDIRVTSPIQTSNTGFTLEFDFDSNPYFSNRILTKTYIYADELDFFGMFECSHVMGDTIHWKFGKNLVEHATSDDDDDDDWEESFFTFFRPSPLITTPEADEADEEERDMLLEEDLELGEALKDRIIPRSVEYFTGEAEYYEDDSDSDEDDEGKDDDGDDSQGKDKDV